MSEGCCCDGHLSITSGFQFWIRLQGGYTSALAYGKISATNYFYEGDGLFKNCVFVILTLIVLLAHC